MISSSIVVVFESATGQMNKDYDVFISFANSLDLA